MGKWYEAAKPVRATMDKAGGYLTDQEASAVADLYPTMHFDGSLIRAGTRIQWNGELKRAAVDLWDTYENCPDAAPALWSSINYRDGVRVIPEVITTDLAFALGELGWWAGTVYESLLDTNTWTPEQYADGWKAVS